MPASLNPTFLVVSATTFGKMMDMDDEYQDKEVTLINTYKVNGQYMHKIFVRENDDC